VARFQLARLASASGRSGVQQTKEGGPRHGSVDMPKPSVKGGHSKRMN